VIQYTLKNADIVHVERSEAKGSVSVKGSKLTVPGSSTKVFDLKEASFVYPALVNIHDHMRGNYLPRVGPNGDLYYENWSYWDADLKSSPVYQERANITIDQMYALSAYKNLFSGVATVNDHFPHEINSPFIPTLPIRVIEAYTLAHECSSYDLKWGEGMEVEHARALERNWPFITHLEEGFDPEAQDGIGILERAGCLDDHDVFIHCIGFSDQDIAKTAKAKASIAWCPASNIFMFNVTCKIKKILAAGINVAIGTDSTHTGSANILEEMRFARETYRKLYGEDLSARTLFAMVTANPAKAFRMETSIGSLDAGKQADILVMKAVKDDPYENLASARMEDVELLTVDGVPVLAERRFADLLPDGGKGYEEVNSGGRPVLVKGNPATLYRAIRKAVGFKKTLDYLPFEP
jgi:5-methylthioadenosine/S-adenosylhomocysteine deaminase